MLDLPTVPSEEEGINCGGPGRGHGLKPEAHKKITSVYPTETTKDWLWAGPQGSWSGPTQALVQFYERIHKNANNSIMAYNSKVDDDRARVEYEISIKYSIFNIYIAHP